MRLQRIAEAARRHPERAFTTLAHHIDIDWLREAYRRTRKDGATGIDGRTASEYAEKLEENLQSLLDRFKSGAYRAPPVRRVHIPIGVQYAVRKVVNDLTVRQPFDFFVAINRPRYNSYVESWTRIPRETLRSDAAITRGIRSVIASTPSETSDRIDVQVHGGTAILRGNVANWEQRSAATQDAFQGGALAVDNRLQVK